MNKKLFVTSMAMLFTAACMAQDLLTLKNGEITMTVSPQQGGKILSLKYKEQEVISQSKFPESFGSTFWTSPQKEWNWPPVPEFDKQPYDAEEYSPLQGENKDGFVLISKKSVKLGYRIRKEFSIDSKDGAIVITYSIINETDEVRQVAPWEITRVPNDGGIIFFQAPRESVTPADLIPTEQKYGVLWCKTDETGANRKVNADGEGWLAYAKSGLLLVKRFDNLTPSQPAPGEAEIQIYINRGKTFIELESQGAYSVLQPHSELSWTVRWYLLPVGKTESPSKALLRKVKSLVK